MSTSFCLSHKSINSHGASCVRIRPENLTAEPFMQNNRCFLLIWLNKFLSAESLNKTSLTHLFARLHSAPFRS